MEVSSTVNYSIVFLRQCRLFCFAKRKENFVALFLHKAFAIVCHSRKCQRWSTCYEDEGMGGSHICFGSLFCKESGARWFGGFFDEVPERMRGQPPAT
jgi:hypothetical protein